MKIISYKNERVGVTVFNSSEEVLQVAQNDALPQEVEFDSVESACESLYGSGNYHVVQGSGDAEVLEIKFQHLGRSAVESAIALLSI